MNFVPSGSQMPERSGLPSAARGAGAARFGLPSGSRGTPGVGYLSHCADTGTARLATTATAAHTCEVFIGSSRDSGRCYHGAGARADSTRRDMLYRSR